MNLSDLKKPFDPKRISWRVGSTNADKTKGMALAYIDSRDVQDRLDEVCGLEWGCRYALLGQTTICEIGIKVWSEWIWRADGSGDTDFEAEKGALSSAFKRAAVKWGVGRYLYDVDAPWVEIKARGKSFYIEASEMTKLQRLLGAPPAPKPDPQAGMTLEQKMALQVTPKPSTEAPEDKTRAWAEKSIDALRGFKDKAEFLSWYSPAIKGAVKRLGDLDGELQDRLTNAIIATQDRLDPLS